MLDRYDVGGRLRYIREFVWRGGGLGLQATRGADGQLRDVWYALRAEWPAAVLDREEDAGESGLVNWRTPVVEGRWVRGWNGYELRVGIDLGAPSAIYIRSRGFGSQVPFVGRPPDQVEHVLSGELTTYVHAFLDHCRTVPQATAEDARRLRAAGY
ncbi:MAG: hypothetical protein JO057_06110 [Chloroflexi bacterium]|nr:hypothetical protein [Chloroflexota bacterium]